jgi:hypothetical protein
MRSLQEHILRINCDRTVHTGSWSHFFNRIFQVGEILYELGPHSRSYSGTVRTKMDVSLQILCRPPLSEAILVTGWGGP